MRGSAKAAHNCRAQQHCIERLVSPPDFFEKQRAEWYSERYCTGPSGHCARSRARQRASSPQPQSTFLYYTADARGQHQQRSKTLYSCDVHTSCTTVPSLANARGGNTK